MNKTWKATSKRVPLVLSQSINNGTSFTFNVIPQFPFRADHLVCDVGTASSLSVTMISVGPNLQIAGGANNAVFSGLTFPPTQTWCMELGCDIANEGNQLSLTATSTLTTGSATYAIWINGTCAVEATGSQAQAHAASVAAGISQAGNWVGGISPAAQYRGPLG